jgi:serine/threonine-protein kinase RsbW
MDGTRLTIPGRLDQVEQVCVLVGQSARAAGFDRRTAYACQLAVTEACENIILHGYGGEDVGEITVSAETAPGELAVELEDRAPPFNPSTKPPPPTWPRDDPPVGGLGLRIIHRVMDEIKYRRSGDRNVLRLVKRLPPPT